MSPWSGGGGYLNNILIPSAGFPGQPSNRVGFAAAPGYPGSLTPWPFGQIPVAGMTYSFYDIDSTATFIANSSNSTTLTASSVTGQPISQFSWLRGAGVPNATVITGFGSGTGGNGTYVTGVNTTLTNVQCTANSGFGVGADNVTFYGCRFQSNDCGVTFPPSANSSSTSGGNNFQVGNVFNSTPHNTKFSYCSFTPRVAIVPNIPGGGVWPCYGAGIQNPNESLYSVDPDSGYQFGVDNYGVNTILDHCDMWGGANAITAHGNFFAALGSITVKDCWIHDFCTDGVDTNNHIHYHTDGPGNIDNSGCSNFIIEHCTIALVAGGANCIAFQGGASTAYVNVKVDNCFLSGDGATIDMGHGNVTGCTGVVFTNNTYSSVMQTNSGAIANDNSPTFTGIPSNIWRNNKFSFWPGTIPGVGTFPQWTPSQDGQYVWPTSSNSSGGGQGFQTTDWTG